MKNILSLGFMLCFLIWMAEACSTNTSTSGPIKSNLTPTPISATTPGTATPTSVAASGIAVTITYGGSFNFSSSTATITHGQSVVWDSSLNGHTVTLDSFSGTTGSTGTNTSSFPATINFPTAGTYYYHCGVSGHSGCGTTSYGVCSGGSGMIGSVVVN